MHRLLLSLFGLLTFITVAHGATLSLDCALDTTSGSPPCNAAEVLFDNYAHSWRYEQTTPAGSGPVDGNASFRLELRGEDVKDTNPSRDSDRVQIRFPASQNLCTNYLSGTGCWYGYWTWIPSNSAGGNGVDSWRDSVTLSGNGVNMLYPTPIHDACDISSQTNHPFFIKIDNSASAGPLTWKVDAYASTPECGTVRENTLSQQIGTVTRGQWIPFVVYMRGSTRTGAYGTGSVLNSNGILRVWINGVQVLNQTNFKIGLNNANTKLGLRIGVYSSAFEAHPNGPNHADDILVAYYDHLRVCNESQDATCSFADVDPQQGSEPTPVVPTFASCSIGNANPACVDINLSDDGAAILPATDCTGFTPSVNLSPSGGDRTVASCTRQSAFLQRVCFNGDPALPADIVQVRYTPGNITDDDSNALATFGDQVCTNTIGPSLLSASTESSTSGNFQGTHPSSRLYDGNVLDGASGSAACTADGCWVEHDLGAIYTLETFRIYGDNGGTWQCGTVDLGYKSAAEDGLTTAFTGFDCNQQIWLTQSGSWTGRYFRTTFHKAAGAQQPQMFEVQLYGEVASFEDEPSAFVLKGQIMKGLTQ